MTNFKLLTALALLSSTVYAQFATHNGLDFLVDGGSFNFAGTNVYGAGFVTAQYAADVMAAVKADGYRVLRCWAFNEYDTVSTYTPPVYFQSWSNGAPTVNAGANGLQLLDAVVQQAEAEGIKLILTLTNNWRDYGGMDVYVNNTLGPGQPHDLFYTNPQIVTHYQSYINAVVSRYSSSSAIFSWELANEARCSGSGPNPQSSGCTPDVLTTWADTMSTYIKSIDPNHMVSFGGEGFFNHPENPAYEYNGGSGQDYDALLALPNIDFGTMHLYIGDTTGSRNTDWAMQWLADHETASVTANKPVILEEYGISRSDTAYDRQTVYDQLHAYELSSKSINGDMTWGSLVVGAACPGDDVYAICSADADYADLVTDWVVEMNGKEQ
ncbi:hypothetical protein FE257_008954 [Aspergillus nanangensis]|uniref:mannan endo-1,4-beta-mannosidase n=1 Tax=Aspergillus nanangensis TaxID=2582783 RepID=A0AAD4GZS9_ASPNN|nr:hypothetical protein FE257_008954 [Aspergillus nanangensis]